KLSQATLTFYDGSEAVLNANTELSIDQLNALRPEDGYRTVVMTQLVGDSDHSVAFRNDGSSRYEVNTPSGAGIARGTKFHVLVTADLLARYIVTEGRVDVSAAGRTVFVTAGKRSTIRVGAMPDEPTFSVSGEGEVEGMGAEWTIAGQTFQTHEQTIIFGNPQRGDLVQVDGHLLPDGSRVADRIVLLRRAIVNQFSLTGVVSSMGASWTVAAQTMVVNGETAVDANIAIGDNVRVEGIILSDGTLQAAQITLLDDTLGLPFEFSGIVQAVSADNWTVSGKMIFVEVATTIGSAIVVGDVVTVRGRILADDTWVAHNIKLMTASLPTFEFTGLIDSLTPWKVAGITFDTRQWTIIASGLAVGDLVRVQGVILN
ncbi:MAG: hypothetical protein GY943_08875, partial [Chloroflexi bacterium]|nr:hypothetical protein [Chloroflexota bacterium]